MAKTKAVVQKEEAQEEVKYGPITGDFEAGKIIVELDVVEVAVYVAEKLSGKLGWFGPVLSKILTKAIAS